MHSKFVYTSSKHKSLNHKFVQFTVTASKTDHQFIYPSTHNCSKIKITFCKQSHESATLMQSNIIGRSCHMYFCWDKHFVATNTFVATKVCLSQRTFLLQQIFVMTNVILLQQQFCHDKLTFAMTNMCLSWQNMSFIATKVCLWQTHVCHVKIVLSRQNLNINLSQQKFCHCKHTFFTTKDAF